MGHFRGWGCGWGEGRVTVGLTAICDDFESGSKIAEIVGMTDCDDWTQSRHCIWA